jgi:predicted MFS family arabinose efflux permease
MFAATGRNDGLVALFAGLVAGLEIPSMMIGASLVARFPKTKVIALGAAVHAAFLVSFAMSAHIGPVLLLTLPAGFGAGLLLMIPIGYVQDLLGHRPGAGGALIAVHQFLMAAFGALAFAIGTEIQGYATAALVSAVIVLSGAALLVWLDRRRGAPVPG